MKFNIERLKEMARPMTSEEKEALEYRTENAEWLRISAAIALRIRKILRGKKMSQVELAKALSVSPAQVSKILSGKLNFEIKTISKLQSVLGCPIIDIPFYNTEDIIVESFQMEARGNQHEKLKESLACEDSAGYSSHSDLM